MFGIWAPAVLSFCFTIIESALASTLVHQTKKAPRIASLTPVVVLAIGVSVVAALTAVYLCIANTRQHSNLLVNHGPWRQYWTCFGVMLTASLLEGCGMIWSNIQWPIIRTPLQSDMTAVVKSWSVMWVLAVIARGILLVLVGSRLKKTLSSDSIRQRALQIVRERSPTGYVVHELRQSLGSRATPRTPPRTASPTASSSLLTSTTKVGSSIRSKITRYSTRSSLEVESQRAVKTSSPVNAFDNWDTTSVDQGTRETILSSSPPATHSGLDTIPGSRPGSELDTDNKSFLPASPRLGRPQSSNGVSGIPEIATMPGVAVADGQYSSPPRNFSRPASKLHNRDSILCDLPLSPVKLSNKSTFTARPSASMNDLIHPLFRPDSPQPPPPILSPRTMVTASPLADRPMSPILLGRLRSDLQPQQPLVARPSNKRKASTGSMSSEKRKPTPLFNPSETANVRARSRSNPQTSGSFATPSPNLVAKTLKPIPSFVPASPALASYRPLLSLQPPSPALTRSWTNGTGSPELSCCDDEDDEILLPEFIMNAGARSSLVDYGRRKSVKHVRTPSAVLDMV